VSARVRTALAGLVIAVAVVIAVMNLGTTARTAAARPRELPELVTRTFVAVRPQQRLVLPAHPSHRILNIPVLIYHRVAWPIPPSANGREFTVAPHNFDLQMNWLQDHGFHPITQATLFRALADNGKLPAKPIVITIDDGYVDGVHAILHGLVTRTHRWPATFFIITGRIGKGPFLSWPDIHLLEGSGMDIGSHTVFHTPLARLNPAQLRFELTRSRRTLTAGLGHPIYWFAYPYGSVDYGAQQAVMHAGYLLAYTTVPGAWLSISGRVALPRIDVTGQETLQQFAAALGG
jgi:peptidoglycan/xylan/chitin deacetylase (PgdA/CDA1 family)